MVTAAAAGRKGYRAFMPRLHRPFALVSAAVLVSLPLAACQSTPSGEGQAGESPTDTIRRIKAEEVRMQRQMDAYRQEARGDWTPVQTPTDPLLGEPAGRNFQPRD